MTQVGVKTPLEKHELKEAPQGGATINDWTVCSMAGSGR